MEKKLLLAFVSPAIGATLHTFLDLRALITELLPEYQSLQVCSINVSNKSFQKGQRENG